MKDSEKYIGMDLDGTITPIGLNNQKVRLPWWLWYLLVPILLLLGPSKAVVKKMQLMEARGYKFILIVARPKQSFRFTRWLLRHHHVPFVGLFCVDYGKGVNERKLKVIREQKLETFVDSDQSVVEFMKRNSINAVNSLDCLSGLDKS